MALGPEAVEEEVHGAQPRIEDLTDAPVHTFEAGLVFAGSHGFVACVPLHVKSVHQIHQIEIDLVKAMEVTVGHELFQVTGIILDK